MLMWLYKTRNCSTVQDNFHYVCINVRCCAVNAMTYLKPRCSFPRRLDAETARTFENGMKIKFSNSSAVPERCARGANATPYHKIIRPALGTFHFSSRI